MNKLNKELLKANIVNSKDLYVFTFKINYDIIKKRR